MLPREVFTAALKKDMTAVQDWLAQGGNPNEGLEQRTQTGFYVYQAGTTLLMVAAYRGRLDVVRLLVEAGADVNVRLPDDGRSALIFAVASCHADCIEYLLAHGGIVDGTQIKFCVISPFNTNPVAINIEGACLQYPRIVRMLLAADVPLTTARLDNNRSLEEVAKEIAASCRERAATLGQELTRRQNPVKSRLEVQRRLLITRNTKRANRYAETAKILAGTRLAGHSYKRWVLKDYMALVRVRSLLARGRARHGPETTVVAARLFGSLNGFAGVPNELFWRVVEYAWLGDWRHP